MSKKFWGRTAGRERRLIFGLFTELTISHLSSTI